MIHNFAAISHAWPVCCPVPPAVLTECHSRAVHLVRHKHTIPMVKRASEIRQPKHYGGALVRGTLFRRPCLVACPFSSRSVFGKNTTGEQGPYISERTGKIREMSALLSPDARPSHPLFKEEASYSNSANGQNCSTDGNVETCAIISCSRISFRQSNDFPGFGLTTTGPQFLLRDRVALRT